MHKNKLKEKVSKWKFAVTKVKYLGYIVENGTATINPEKTRAVVDWLVPMLVKQF